MGRKVDDFRVGTGRKHQVYIDACERRFLKRRVEYLRGQVVGGLDPDPLPGAGDGVTVGLQQGAPLAERAAGGDLQDVVGKMPDRRVVLRPRNMRFRSRRPVAQERGLESGGAASFDPEVGVAPCAPLRAADVAVGDVHAADESDAAVYHDDLAVVAVIDLAGEEREFDVQEGVYFDPGVAHPFEKGVLGTPAAYVVVEDAYPDAFARLCDQGVPQAATRLVVVEDVILDMDVVPCAGDLLHQRFHLRPSVVERYGVQRIEQQ